MFNCIKDSNKKNLQMSSNINVSVDTVILELLDFKRIYQY